MLGLIIGLIIVILLGIALQQVIAGTNICSVPVISLFCSCPDGTESDLNGECYACPVNSAGVQLDRTVYSVDSDMACNKMTCGAAYPGSIGYAGNSDCYMCPNETAQNATGVLNIGNSGACSGNCDAVKSGSTTSGTTCYTCPDGQSKNALASWDSDSACGDTGTLAENAGPAIKWGTIDTTAVDAIYIGDTYSSAEIYEKTL